MPAAVDAFGSAKPGDTGDLRERILRASVELIEAHGLAGTSLRLSQLLALARANVTA